MSLTITESDLLINLSEEQEELVSGGGQLTKLYLNKWANFEASETIVSNTVLAGGGGSGTQFLVQNAHISSSAGDIASLYFN